MALLSNLSKYKDAGLLIMRVGIGILFMHYGYPKLLGGPSMWKEVGTSMKHIGVDFYPTFWGFMAAITETFGGFLFILGLAFRPVSLLLAFTMLIAALHHIGSGDGLMAAAHAMEAGVVFLGLIFVGPGKYSVDKK